VIGVDNRTGPRAALIVEDIRAIHAMRSQGSTAPEIARSYGVSVRTVWRYLAASIVHTTIAGHPMTFLVYPGRRPVLVDSRSRK
jgi:hypothetical protein